MGCNSLLLNYDGSNPNMAYFKIGKYHHSNIAADRVTGGLLVVKRAIIYKDHNRSHYYYAFGIATIGIGLLFTTGF